MSTEKGQQHPKKLLRKKANGKKDFRAQHIPGEDKGAFGAVVEGVESARGGGRLGEAVEVVGIILEAAVIVPRRHRHRAEAERQPHIVVGYGVRRRIHLGRGHENSQSLLGGLASVWSVC